MQWPRDISGSAPLSHVPPANWAQGSSTPGLPKPRRSLNPPVTLKHRNCLLNGITSLRLTECLGKTSVFRPQLGVRILAGGKAELFLQKSLEGTVRRTHVNVPRDLWLKPDSASDLGRALCASRPQRTMQTVLSSPRCELEYSWASCALSSRGREVAGLRIKP